MDVKRFHETNPSSKWLKERFAVRLETAGGALIYVRFDLQSSQFKFTPKTVEERFGPLVENEDLYKFAPDILLEAVASELNREMEWIHAEVISQTAYANSLLADLEHGNWNIAYDKLDRLGRSLEKFGVQSERVWRLWMTDLARYIITMNGLKFDGEL